MQRTKCRRTNCIATSGNDIERCNAISPTWSAVTSFGNACEAGWSLTLKVCSLRSIDEAALACTSLKKSSAPVQENEHAIRYLMIEGNHVSRSFNGLPIKSGSRAPGGFWIVDGVAGWLTTAFAVFDDRRMWVNALMASEVDGLYCSQSATRNSVLDTADALSSFTSSIFLYPLLYRMRRMR